MAETSTQPPTQEPRERQYIIVDFLALDPRLITFGEPKVNAHGGRYVPMRYSGKNLYVRYSRPQMVPFGINSNTDEGGKVTGFSFGMSTPPEDPYFAKAQELDQYFIQQCIRNSVCWRLGGTAETPVVPEIISGCDDKGRLGKWLRLLKWAKTEDKKKGTCDYLPYPPRMEFTVPSKGGKEIRTRFFDQDGNVCDSTDNAVLLPKFSRVSAVAQWSSISLGIFGASLKPKVIQCRVYPNDSRPPRDELLLDDDVIQNVEIDIF